MRVNIIYTHHPGHKLWEQILLGAGGLWGSSSRACCCRTCGGSCGRCGCRSSCGLSTWTGRCICSLCGVWCYWCCWWSWGGTDSTSTKWRQRSQSHAITFNQPRYKKIQMHFRLLSQCKWGLRYFGMLCGTDWLLLMFRDSLSAPPSQNKQSKETAWHG
jgi:hypothetical protein